jgi:predicted MFS family arabinose efflux permease
MRIQQTPTAVALKGRLRPLYLAVFLQGFLLWLPVEKVFMNQIGFTPVSVGVMAAAYAAVTPLLEIPSGILADRWSRRGVLVLSAVALLLASLVGGLSDSVPTYIVSAMILGAYFALYSGVSESVVYDLVLEVTGTSDGFPRYLGRVRLLEGAALVVSSLIGGWLAGLFGSRMTYFITLPFAVLAIVAYARLQEPGLFRAGVREPLRAHLALTFRTITGRGVALPIVILGALTAMLAQLIYEFGPLWLVAVAAPAVVFGPYWAGLMSTIGLGGLIASRVRLDRPVVAAGLVFVLILASALLSVQSSLAFVIPAQIVVALLLAIAGIHVSALLHDAIPSAIRAGVASGVSTIAWIGFLPFALGFGWVTGVFGTGVSGWLITGTAVIAGGLLIRLSLRRPRNSDLSGPTHYPERQLA